jgi:S-DNA-T family DNA segregation ATPase FtsK/SpoIIIE
VVSHLTRAEQPEFIEDILQDSEETIPGLTVGNGGSSVEDSDPLYDEAVRIVTETRRASISGVQRRLKIGYNRAARMIEEMERTGVVSVAEGNGSREVLAPPPPE